MQLANKSHKNILALNIVLFFYIKEAYLFIIMGTGIHILVLVKYKPYSIYFVMNYKIRKVY